MIRIYLMLKSQYLKTQMEYTVNFWMMIISGVIMRGLMMTAVFVLFRNIPDIAGWQEGEVFLILGFMIVTEGLHNLLFDGVWYIPTLVFRGELDIYLSRPISPLYQVISNELGLHGIGNTTMGIASIGLGLVHMGWVTPWAIALCLFFIVTGTILRLSYNLISLSHVFWIHGGIMNFGFFIHSVGEFAKYPVTIYPFAMRFVLLFIIPAGFIGFVPALILRSDGALMYAAALVAMTVVYFLVARGIFYRGVKRYESIGM